jgi:DNA-binding SARP family transcriptional activator
LTRAAAGPDTSPTLSVRLLGQLDIRAGETPVPPLESARAESLLAYLLIHRDAAQPRQRLAFMLWPDSTEPQARTNLRHVLHKLRRTLPDSDALLEVTPRTLRWRPDAAVELDVEAFEAALARGDGVEGLRAAAGAYTGDLLEGSYDEWVLDERERLRALHLDALDRLIALLEERGEDEEAIRYAERLVRDDPLREDAYRALMRLHDARGDRARALRAYHACAAALERDLGVEPSAATREAHEALLPGAETHRVGGGAAGAPLVGRAAERTRLTQLWRASERGRAQLVVVTGEAGIGKTRLVEELRAWCASRGAITAEARSYAAEGALAYGPVVAWLRAEPLAARRRALDDRRLAELARLLPELDRDPPPPLPEDEQRTRLFDAAARAILASGRPRLLVADDLHWADRETLRFLHYLIRSRPSAPLLIAATARAEDLDRLQELTTALRTLERCTEIELGRLSRRETARLAEQLGQAALEPPAAERLYAGTEGNPLFVVEALRAGWEGDALTPRVQAVIGARLAQLTLPAAALARTAAALGREFTAGVLEEAAGADVTAALDELWRRRIVRDRGADAYDFTHDRIREVAYRALDPGERRRTHLRIARALEASGDPGAIAAHYERAGDAGRAVTWYVRAAEAAQRVNAGAEAVGLLERALALTAHAPERELELVTAIVAPLAMLEGYSSPRLRELQRRGVELAPAPEPTLLRSLALTALSHGDFDTAARCATQLRRGGDDSLVTESDYVLGIAAFWRGELHAAREHFEAAVARYRPEDRTTHVHRYGMDPQVVCQSRLANTLWFLGHEDAARRARDVALALAAEVGHPASAATARVFAALLALELRDHDAVRAQAAELGVRDVKVIEASLAALTGYLDVLDGRAAAGLGRLRRAVEETGEGGHAPGERAIYARLLAEAGAIAGDPETGLQATDVLLAGTTRVWAAEALRLRAVFRAELGHDDAGDDLERALDVARAQGARALEHRIRGTLAERPAPHPARP